MTCRNDASSGPPPAPAPAGAYGRCPPAAPAMTGTAGGGSLCQGCSVSPLYISWPCRCLLVSVWPYYTRNPQIMRTGFCPVSVIMPILLKAGMACGEGPLCGSPKMVVMCVSAARYVPCPYLQGCILPERAGFPGGLAGQKFLRSAQKSSHIFRRLHRPDGLFRGDRQPLHQPPELLRRQGAHLIRGTRPLEPAF